MLVPYGVIYLVRNKVNGKIYIGQTTTLPEKRWQQHQWFAKKGYKGLFNNAIRKYGPDSFQVVMLHQAFDKAELDEMEKRAIWSHESTNPEFGYNVAVGGVGLGKGPDNPLYGVPKTPEHIAKLKEAFKHRPPVSEETRRKQSIAGRGRKLPPRSAEYRRRQSESHKGKLIGSANPFFGKTHSRELAAWIGEKSSAASKPGVTGFKGVTFQPDHGDYPYRVGLTVMGKKYHVGYFRTPEEAALAYNEKTVELRGDKARLNIIPIAA